VLMEREKIMRKRRFIYTSLVSFSYRGYPPREGADDLGHAASGRVQHAVGAGLEQQHTGQVEDQGRVLRLLQLLGESLAVQEQRLPGRHTHTHISFSICIYIYILVL